MESDRAVRKDPGHTQQEIVMRIRPKGQGDLPAASTKVVLKARRYDRDRANGRHVIAGEGNCTLRLLKRPGLHTLLKRIALQDGVTMQKLFLDTLSKMARERVPSLVRDDEDYE